MNAADVALRFLESVGRRAEAEFYLDLFRAQPKERFAAISIDANVARHAIEAVVLDLRFLSNLGLSPVVVLGFFEPTEAPEQALRLRRKLDREGVMAEVVPHDEHTLTMIETNARAGVIPIIAFGPHAFGVPEERIARLSAILSALRTRKLIFLHRPGGLRQQGALVPIVNLTKDYEALASSRELSRKERAILQVSRQLVLDLVAHPLGVSITSPLNLLRELFTTKGAGTLLRRGAIIHRREDFAALDRDRLRILLTSAFGRAPRESFFDSPIAVTYLEENYRGAAMLVETPLGMYLSKFAVGREAQGEGIGRDLWDRLTQDYATFFWRARPTNAIDEWYTKRCDGMMRFANWHVFWRGLDPARVPEAIAFSLSQPIDMEELPA